ncbi:protein max-like isoform X2 [Planococcus citri]|uniref:protein max-like isoform X2 n=1 Tax=Planococcus citri TaxID=170843 RepID=UPI0031F84D0D
MSDDDRDLELESAEKRAHHNALERKRRDHIKDSFTSLRESVPSLQGEKVASRAQILKKAADYIQFMRRKNSAHQQDIDDLKRQNVLLESQIESSELNVDGTNFDESDSSSSDSEADVIPRHKKLKTKKFS